MAYLVIIPWMQVPAPLRAARARPDRQAGEDGAHEADRLVEERRRGHQEAQVVRRFACNHTTTYFVVIPLPAEDTKKHTARHCPLLSVTVRYCGRYRGLNWAALYNKHLGPPMEGCSRVPEVPPLLLLGHHTMLTWASYHR